MTEIEQQGLVLFKDYTMLQLKAFRVSEEERLSGGAGGATEPYIFMVIDQALRFHQIYVHHKLNKPKENG